MDEIKSKIAEIAAQSAAQSVRLDRLDADVQRVVTSVDGLTASVSELVAVQRERMAVEAATREQTEEIRKAPKRIDTLEERIAKIQEAAPPGTAIAIAGERERLSSSVIRIANDTGVRRLMMGAGVVVVLTAMSCAGGASFSDVSGYIGRVAGALSATDSPSPRPTEPGPAPSLSPLP